MGNERPYQVRSHGRHITINFFFNFEKIYTNKRFADKCAVNTFDLLKTLDKFNYKSSVNDYIPSYRLRRPLINDKI